MLAVWKQEMSAWFMCFGAFTKLSANKMHAIKNCIHIMMKMKSEPDEKVESKNNLMMRIQICLYCCVCFKEVETMCIMLVNTINVGSSSS